MVPTRESDYFDLLQIYRVQPQTDFKSNARLVTSKTVFYITIIVAVLTILSIWLLGLGSHRTLFANSLLSTTILSGAFFLFLTVGLYNGIKLKDDLGKITDKIRLHKPPDLSGMDFKPDLPDGDGEGCLGAILAILAWILAAILVLVLIWLLSNLLWAMVLVFAAMLYWIFFRALRFVFRHARECKGRLLPSLGYAITYTLLYNSWIYGIILAAHYLVP